MAPPTDLANATLGPQALPQLQRIDIGSSTSAISPPVKRIQSDADLQHWRRTKSYHDTALFVARLAEASVGKETRLLSEASSSISSSAGVQSVVQLLLELRKWTEEIEPRAGAQRFGNLAFRDWGARLEEHSDNLHDRLLVDYPQLKPYTMELKAYLYDSFGSFVRIDYGSGHEVNFLAWLAYLCRLDFFGSYSSDGEKLSLPSEVESDLALVVVPLYLEIVWTLQDRYGLEPAGSHGVWGLDDYQFLPYILGAAQLRLQTMYKPSQISLPSHKPPSKPTPAQLLEFVPREGSPPFANLFTSSIARIHALKTGPFFEHSPLLYDISTSVPNWKKVSSGMLKMWDNEVVGKRPVVQHFVFGGVGYVWDDVQEGSGGGETTTAAAAPNVGRTPPSMTSTRTAMPATGAPWAAASSATRPPSTLPPTGAPWASSQASTRAPPAAAMPPTGAPWASSHASTRAPPAAAMPPTGAPRASGSTATPSTMTPPAMAPWARTTTMPPPSLGPRAGKAEETNVRQSEPSASQEKQ